MLKTVDVRESETPRDGGAPAETDGPVCIVFFFFIIILIVIIF